MYAAALRGVISVVARERLAIRRFPSWAVSPNKVSSATGGDSFEALHEIHAERGEPVAVIAAHHALGDGLQSHHLGGLHQAHDARLREAMLERMGGELGVELDQAHRRVIEDGHARADHVEVIDGHRHADAREHIERRHHFVRDA